MSHNYKVDPETYKSPYKREREVPITLHETLTYFDQALL